MTHPFPRLFLALTLVLATAAQAQPGQGPGSGRGEGKGTRARCGSTLAVVAPEGAERAIPAAEILQGLPSKEISQGETPRAAVRLDDLLKKQGARWVKVTDCAEMSYELPSGLPVEGEVYAVVTGRGSLKFVREVRPGVFSNIVQNVKRL